MKKTQRTLLLVGSLSLFLPSNQAQLEAQVPSPLQLVYRSAYGPANAVVTHGNWLFVGSGAAVRIFGLADISTPVERGRLFFSDVIADLEINSHFLFVATHNDGITIIDVSDVDSPMRVSEIKTVSVIASLTINDTLLFVDGRKEGTFIYSIRNPEQPKLLANIKPFRKGVEAQSIAAFSDKLIIAEANGIWRLFDLASPTDPNLLGQFDADVPIASIIARDTLIFIVAAQIPSQITIYRIQHPIKVVELVRFSLSGIGCGQWWPLKLILYGNWLIMTSRLGGLAILDIIKPDEPRVIVNRCRGGIDVAVQDSILYLPYKALGVEVVDATTPANIRTITTIFVGTRVSYLRENDKRIFAGRSPYSLGFNILAELKPTLSSQEAFLLDTLHVVSGKFEVLNDIIFAAPSGELVDISEPGEMRRLSRLPHPYFGSPDINDIALINDTLAITAVDGSHLGDFGGVELFSVRNASNPRLLDFLNITTWGNHNLEARNDLVFLVSRNTFYVLSISTGDSIITVATLPLSAFIGRVLALYNDFAYLFRQEINLEPFSIEHRELVVINISDPANPRKLNSVTLSFDVRQLVIHKDHLLMLDENRNLYVYAVTNPIAPDSLTRISFTLPVKSFNFNEVGHLLLANGDAGLSVWEWPFTTEVQTTMNDDELIPEVFEILPIYPNPVVSSLHISFELHKSSNVRLTIYNILGQELKSFEEMSLSAGLHSVHWNGKNDHGTFVPSGIYIVELTDGFKKISRKFTIVK